MEYAIPIAVVLMFYTFFIITTPKLRQSHHKLLNEEEFNNYLKEQIELFPLPKNTKSLDESSIYKKTIKKCIKQLKKNSIHSKTFSEYYLSNKEKIDKMLKADYSAIHQLPSSGKYSRVYLLAKISISHSKFMFLHDRVSQVMNTQNDIKPLNFSEINNMRNVFSYILLNRLAEISNTIINLIKLEKYAKKYSKNYKNYQHTPIYKELKNNACFIKLCCDNITSEQKGSELELMVDSTTFFDIYSTTIKSLIEELTNIFMSLDSIEYYDFSIFYKPLSLLENFESFIKSTKTAKDNFLILIQNLSDRENIDEYEYTKRLVNFKSNSIINNFNNKPIKIGDRTLNLLYTKDDLLKLARALNSSEYFQIYFSNTNKKRKNMLESSLANSFSYFYKSDDINVKILRNENRIKIIPTLPKNVNEVSFLLNIDDVENKIKLISTDNGEEQSIYIGGTRIYGINEIVLSDIPLDIKIEVNRQ